MDAETMLERFGAALREIVREELRAGLEVAAPLPEVVSLKDAAKRLACSERTIRRLARAGQLVLVRVGETPKVPMSELRRIASPHRPAMPELGRPRKARPQPRRRTPAMSESSKVLAELAKRRQR